MKELCTLKKWIVFVWLLWGHSLWAQQNETPLGGDAGAVFACTLDGTIWSINVATAKATPLTAASFLLNGVNSLALDTVNRLLYYTGQNNINRDLYAYNYLTHKHDTISNFRNNANRINANLAEGLGKGAADFRNGKLYLGVENVAPPAPNLPIDVKDRIYEITFVPGSNGTRVNTITEKFSYPSKNDWGDIAFLNDSILINNVDSFIYTININTGTITGTHRKTYFGQIAKTNNGEFWNIDEDIQKVNTTDLTSFGQLMESPKLINIDCVTPWPVPLTQFDPGKDAIDAAGPVPATNVLGDVVWNDVDCDGIQDVVETGIAGAIIEIWDDVNSNKRIDANSTCPDRLLATVTSAADGSYRFTNVLPGDYILRVTNAGTIIPGGAVTNNGMRIVNMAGVGENVGVIDFGVSNCLLPVTLSSFKAAQRDCRAHLQWVTATEFNVGYFAIERSVDGVDYTTINTVLAKGFSGTEQIYTFEDAKLQPTAYYRLKMVDRDGSYQYSPVEKIVFDCKVENDVINVFPNPVMDELTLTLQTTQSGATQVVVKNIQQQQVAIYEKTLDKGTNTLTLPVGDLMPGTYFIQLHNAATGRMTTQRFVKL